MHCGERNSPEEVDEVVNDVVRGFQSIHGNQGGVGQSVQRYWAPSDVENSEEEDCDDGDFMDMAISKLRRKDLSASRVRGIRSLRVDAPTRTSSPGGTLTRKFGIGTPEKSDSHEGEVGNGVETSTELGTEGIRRFPEPESRSTEDVDISSSVDPAPADGGDHREISRTANRDGEATGGLERTTAELAETGHAVNDDSAVLFKEDVVESESMENYTQTLLENISNSVVYAGDGGEGGTIDPSAAKFLEEMDDAMFPIRHDGWFREGTRKKRKTKHVLFHHPNMLSHNYVQTHPEGMLHVLPGWTHDLFISDIAYRFKPRSTQLECEVPFLGGRLCTIKTYDCLGVHVCKKCSTDFVEKGNHIVVDPKDRDALSSVEAVSPAAEARKKVMGMVLALEAKKNSRKGFCNAEVRLTPGGPLVKCPGGPTVVASTAKPGSHFTGCTGFSSNEHMSPKMRQDGFKNFHYANRLNIEGSMLDLFGRFLSGEEPIDSADTSPCTFVRSKHKAKKLCPKHGCKLVHVPGREYCEDKRSSHSMCTIEPDGYHIDTTDEKKVLFVPCVGEHLHPPPPPAEATAMKMRILDYLCSQKKWPSLAQLRIAVETVLEKVEETADGPIKVFDGTMVVPRSVFQRRLRMLRPPVSKLAVEVGELAMMVADEQNTYVRAMQIVGEKYIFFLGLPQLLVFASQRLSFAGDATFRTVTEANRSTADGRWYLYNIVVQASADRLNGTSIVVMRALMTGLSRDVYAAIWTHFFKSILRASNMVRGSVSLDQGCVKVPYIDIAQALSSQTCTVTSITMDYDAAEIHGCTDALVRMCGGTADIHLKNMFFGCSVHLDRDLARRSAEETVQEQSGLRSSELKVLYNAYRWAGTHEEAGRCLEKLRKFDAGWVKWVETNGFGPLLSKTLSQMTSEIRSLGFADTNVVESQNRRGNVYTGTHNRPGDAARKLWSVDKSDLRRLGSGFYNEIVASRGYRRRRDSILRPSGAGALAFGKQKRSNGRGGPVQGQGKRRRGGTMPEKDVPANPPPRGRGGSVRDAAGTRDGGSRRQEGTAVPDPVQVSAYREDILSTRVQDKLSRLLEDIGGMSCGARQMTEEEVEVLQENRMSLVIEMLAAVNEAG